MRWTQVDEVDAVEVDKVEDEDEGGTPDDASWTAAVAAEEGSPLRGRDVDPVGGG